MDSELQKVIVRYTIVGVVISAAAIFTVYTYQDQRHPNGVPDVVGSDAGPGGSAEERPTTAPSVKSMFVEKNGVERVVCKQACRLEAYCSLRDVDDCMAASCDPADRDVRVDVKSDAVFAKADDCAAAALAPCADACRRKEACGVVDDKCVAVCKLRAQQLPGDGYRSARCVIEAKTCADVGGC